ncbi:Uu.00g118570.m01.CDS01 [Anthostomella pinea]|uniref:Uu.00g118570.m01.CDS01 n=1 Tax=Anthostomella pinea TaxID=933095 RepID=A0AAI8VGD1_9PEZI|nr:Uu.00g118570.m01.CDS01 [Anthostomella pinea]
MSQERPEPPSRTDSPEELVAYVTNNPSDWLLYLRHINGYAAALKEENDFFRLAESDHDNSLQSL